MATTQVQQRQIANGAIADAQVAAGANIASNKLADGLNFIKKDGSVAMTGALNMGSQPISFVQSPSAATDAANKSYVDGLFNTFPNLFKYKDEVKAIMTTNVAISNPTTAIFDGVTLVANDRILLVGQTAGAENGIYLFASSTTPMTRSLDADTFGEFPGMMVGSATGGTLNASKIYFCTNTQTGTLGTTSITYILINAAGLAASNFVDKETPAGTINGATTAFTLANTPVSGSEHVYLNGQLQDVGAGNDYTISSSVITMLIAPLTGEKIRVTYRK